MFLLKSSVLSIRQLFWYWCSALFLGFFFLVAYMMEGKKRGLWVALKKRTKNKQHYFYCLFLLSGDFFFRGNVKEKILGKKKKKLTVIIVSDLNEEKSFKRKAFFSLSCSICISKRKYSITQSSFLWAVEDLHDQKVPFPSLSHI